MPASFNWRPLRRRGHALRWHAELIVGELLISMKARGEREGGGGYFRGRSKPTRKSLGLTRGTAWRWQARARAAPARSFNARIAEAADVFALKVLADELAAVARHAQQNDAPGRAIARAARLAAQRAGGMMILATVGWNNEKMDFSSSAAQRWRRLARMTDDVFTALVVAGDEPKSSKYPHHPAPQVAMLISDWAPDELGLLSRTVTAVAVDAGNRQMAAE